MMQKDLDTKPHGEVIYSRQQVEAACSKVSMEVQSWIDSGSSPVIFVTVREGGAFFATQLALKLSNKIEFGSVKTQAYDKRANTRLERPKIFDPLPDVEGKRVLLVDDVLDSGITANLLKETFKELGAVDVKLAVLVRKNNPGRQYDNLADFIAIDHPTNDWLIGWGMDDSGNGRNLTVLSRKVSLPPPPIGHRLIPLINSLNLDETSSLELSVLGASGMPLRSIKKFFEDLGTERVCYSYDAVSELLKFQQEALRNFNRHPAPDEQLIARARFLFELANDLFSKEFEIRPDNPIQEAFSVQPKILLCYGSLLYGVIDPQDLDLKMFGVPISGEYNRGFTTEINQTLAKYCEGYLLESLSFQNGTASVQATSSEPFKLELDAGCSPEYHNPDTRIITKRRPPLLVIMPGRYVKSLQVAFFQGSSHFPADYMERRQGLKWSSE